MALLLYEGALQPSHPTRKPDVFTRRACFLGLVVKRTQRMPDARSVLSCLISFSSDLKRAS